MTEVGDSSSNFLSFAYGLSSAFFYGFACFAINDLGSQKRKGRINSISVNTFF